MKDTGDDREQPSPWAPAAQRDEQRTLKREAVLLTAVRSFNRHGFHATSLEQVADALNITKPTIYYYFSSKDEILFECARRGLERIREVAAARRAPEETGLQRLTAIMRDYAIIMTEDFGQCVIRIGDHELSAASRQKQRSLKREIDQTVRAVIEAGIRDGSIVNRDVRLLTFTITGALNWIAKWYEPDGRYPPEAVAEQCVGLLVDGLAPRAGSDMHPAGRPGQPELA